MLQIEHSQLCVTKDWLFDQNEWKQATQWEHQFNSNRIASNHTHTHTHTYTSSSIRKVFSEFTSYFFSSYSFVFFSFGASTYFWNGPLLWQHPHRIAPHCFIYATHCSVRFVRKWCALVLILQRCEYVCPFLANVSIPLKSIP